MPKSNLHSYIRCSSFHLSFNHAIRPQEKLRSQSVCRAEASKNSSLSFGLLNILYPTFWPQYFSYRFGLFPQNCKNLHSAFLKANKRLPFPHHQPGRGRHTFREMQIEIGNFMLTPSVLYRELRMGYKIQVYIQDTRSKSTFKQRLEGILNFIDA